METATMGIVLVEALIENYDDVRDAEKGRIPAEQVRRIVISDARVDTGATYVSMPRRLIDQLGLKRLKTVEARTTAGPFSFGIYEPVKLTIQGRDCEIRVAEVADNCPRAYASSWGVWVLWERAARHHGTVRLADDRAAFVPSSARITRPLQGRLHHDRQRRHDLHFPGPPPRLDR